MTSLRFWITAAAALACSSARSQTVITEMDHGEKPGARPYEMVWANRREPAPPTLRFDDLRGWTLRVAGGAECILRATRAQNVWNRPVARLRYRGDGKSVSKPTIEIIPATPIDLPSGADCVEMWLYGNRWDWVNPPGTPPVRILLHIKDSTGFAHLLQVDTVRWEEWWLMHRKLPAALKYPARLESIEIAGGWQSEWREIYFDSIRFYRETTLPLRFAPRPKRNLTLSAGQLPGGNNGPGTLPFPTREETILPMQMGGPHKNTIEQAGHAFTFDYAGRDCRIRYRFEPERGLDGITAEIGGAPVGRLMEGGGLKFEDGRTGAFRSARLTGGVVAADYGLGTSIRLTIRQKSLIIDVVNQTGRATEVSFGQVGEVAEPRTIYIPPITYGGSNPTVLFSRAGKRSAFTSIWPDWYRSNASELVGAESVSDRSGRINGSIRYLPKTDGKRNPLFERIFLTVSPQFEEVLPVVPNPVGLHAKEAVDRLWQESWGPDDYAKQMARSRMLKAYGIDKLIQCNHEITWRDGGESFTLRTRAAPKRGGDEALRNYVAHQRSLGWLSGLYSNYTDFIPVNEHWTPDGVQRLSDGEWRSAWPRCWAEKPMKAVEFDALLAPQIKTKFVPNSAYTDVSTAVAPWGYCDFDARVPGAGTFAQTFYCHGEILRNDSRVYGGPTFSEGTYQWIYAGLADGNYGHTYNNRSLATQPLLPVFDLYQIHSKECDIGVSWTAFFCDAIPDWKKPENIDRAIDRFLLSTLAYGHIGWLVEEEHGIARTCRSYYMLQQVQARYGLKQPLRISYWGGERLHSVSEAIDMGLPSSRRQLYVEYPGGLQLWLNDHAAEEWRVHVGGRDLVLPPAGWAAFCEGKLLSYSALDASGRVDYLRSGDYTYQDGRGRWYSTPEAGSNGGLAISPLGPHRLKLIRISGDGEFMIRRPYGMSGSLASCKAYDAQGNTLPNPLVHDSGTETWIEPVKQAIRYDLEFTGRPDWSITPYEGRSAPGSSVPLKITATGPVGWAAVTAQVPNGRLVVPENAPIGSLIRARGLSNALVREVTVRVCPPVELRWRTQPDLDHVYLALAMRWHLKGLTPGPVSFAWRVSDGWTVAPGNEISIDPASPPSEVGSALYSTAPTGATGRLEIFVKGLPQAPRLVFDLKRVEQNPVTTDLRSAPFAWGIARRKAHETREAGGSGALFAPDPNLTVGGITKAGIFVHPPYTGGVGYTWADYGPILIPYAPSEFRAAVGIRDGGDSSDGVRFSVEVVDDKGARRTILDETGIQNKWLPVKADLSPFAGRRVHLRLIADVGPKDNSNADWGCWGEPRIQLTTPRLTTTIKEAAADQR